MTAQPVSDAPTASPKRSRAIRVIAFGRLQDWFLIAAVVTILLIRLQLKLTNYPKLGGGTLHIAHILWGGLAMMVAIGLLLTLLDRRWRLPAALIGGVGFGFFIDEVGKFVTSNNDYFFKPSAAIIYISFVVLYLLTRWLRQRRGFSSPEYVANALDVFSEAAGPDFNDREKRQTLELLDRGADNKLVPALRRLVEATPTAPARDPTRLDRMRLAVRRRYGRLRDSRRFATAVIAVFVLIAALNAVDLLFVALWLFGVDLPVDWHFTVAQAGQAISGLVALALIYLGIARLIAHRRLDAYRLFEYALLVLLFLQQMFDYIERSFVATWGLLVTVLLLISLRIVMRQEMDLAQTTASQTVDVTPPPPSHKRRGASLRSRLRIRPH